MNTGPWEWTLPTTLTVIGLAITLAIAIAGWVMTAIKDSRNAKAAREKYEADVRRADEMNATLKLKRLGNQPKRCVRRWNSSRRPTA